MKNQRLNAGQRAVFKKAEPHVNSYATKVANGEHPNYRSFTNHLERAGVNKSEQQSISDSLKQIYDDIQRGVREAKKYSNDEESADDDF